MIIIHRALSQKKKRKAKRKKRKAQKKENKKGQCYYLFSILVLQSSTMILMIDSLLFCHFHILVGIFHYRTCDAEHPTDITMSRVHLASDTCDIYFTHIKVNHLLYTCSLHPFEDGILRDTPLVCMHRYCRNATDVEEECKR